LKQLHQHAPVEATSTCWTHFNYFTVVFGTFKGHIFNEYPSSFLDLNGQ